MWIMYFFICNGIQKRMLFVTLVHTLQSRVGECGSCIRKLVHAGLFQCLELLSFQFKALRKGRKAKTLLFVISWVILMELDRTNFEIFEWLYGRALDKEFGQLCGLRFLKML